MNFQNHRQKLYEFAAGSPVILTAHDAMQLSADMAAPFVQEGSFWWVTGISEPGWKVIIDTSRKRTVLVRPERSDIQRIFEGESSDIEILSRSHADEIIPMKEFESYLRTLAAHHTLVYTIHDTTAHEFIINPAQRTLHDTLKRIFSSVESIHKHVLEMRAIKTDEEIAAIKKAVALTIDAFARVRSELDSFTHEYEIEAAFTHAFRTRNATHAYEPIIASGEHAVTLHYISNAGRMNAKNLVLIDVGARVEGYCADITRTYARNPTKRQRQVHSAVEKAHERIIKLLGPDLLVSEYIAQVDEIMKDALQEVGLLHDRADTDTYRRYFPHAVSHGLGVDVHDSLGAPRYLREGMVLTVEPGIYIEEEGVGVRIEDDILITATGARNLSGRLPTSL